MAAGEPSWTASFDAVLAEPQRLARQLRADGRAVVGCIGPSVPRALVLAAGLHPLRLMARRISAPAGGLLAPELVADLPTDLAGVVGALAAGTLDWLDAIVIARDSEAHAKLFQVLRELRRLGLLDAAPPLAFLDIARLPGRPAARYNRVRLAELAAQLAEWAPDPDAAPGLEAALARTRASAAALAELNAERRAGRLRASAFLLAAQASEILPEADFAAALGSVPGAPGALQSAASEPAGAGVEPGELRLLLSGSDIDDPAVYRALEASGAQIVGEDHALGEPLTVAPAAGVDPIDALADQLQWGPHGAARSGLAERVARTCALVADTGADAVLQLIVAGDSAPAWETVALAAALAPTTALRTVTLADRGAAGAEDGAALRAGLDALRELIPVG